MPLSPSHSRRWRAVLVSLAALPLLVACTVPAGTFNAGTSALVNGILRAQDGRGTANGIMTTNDSTSSPLTLQSVELIDSHGLEVVDAFTFSPEAQLPVGARVPPRAADYEDDPEHGREVLANWENRVPVNQSVFAPREARLLVVVVRATSPEDCLYAKGLRVNYRQYGRDLYVESNAAVILSYDPVNDQCGAVSDEIFAHPAVG